MFIAATSLAIKAISIFFNSSFKLKYFFAISLCFFNGLTLFSSSSITNLILEIFSFVFSNFFKLTSFLFLYFNTPAASSKIVRRASGLLEMMSATLPWEIMLNESFPAPVSKNKSVISLSLTLLLFKKYSFSPVL